MPRDQKGTRKRKQCTIWPSLGQKFAINTEDTVKFKFQSLFKDQTESWSRNVNDSDICQRSDADPRGRESFRETTCKSKTNTGTVINKWLGLYSYGTETMDWHWNTGVQGSSLFSSVKIHYPIASTQSTSLWRIRCRSPLWPNYWLVQEKAIGRYKILVRRMMQQFANAPHWSLEKWFAVLARGGGQKKRFQYCVNPNYSQNSCTFE